MFALVEEEGERMECRIVAWGMAFEDHVEVVGADRRSSGDLSSVDTAVLVFSLDTKIRLVWSDANAASE